MTDYDHNSMHETSEEYENMGNSRESRSTSPKHAAKPIKPVREVVDVEREYLNLTASVVNMKFPRVNHISSEELINKVKNYNFWEYHDMMVRIMKTEEQKLKAKQKAEQEAKLAANGSSATQQSGMLSRFRNFFGGPSPFKTNENYRQSMNAQNGKRYNISGHNSRARSGSAFSIRPSNKSS